MGQEKTHLNQRPSLDEAFPEGSLTGDAREDVM